MPAENNGKQRHEYWPFGWVTAIWFDVLLMVLFLGTTVARTLAGSRPLAAIGTLLFMAGISWALIMRHKYGWLETIAMPRAQIPMWLCWAAISPAFFLIYAGSGDDAYRSLAFGGLFFSAPSVLMLIALSRPKVRERLRTNIAKEIEERHR